MSFRTVPAPPITNFQYRWPAAAAAELVGVWLDRAVDLPDPMCAELGVSADGVNLHGTMAETEAETVALLNQFCRGLAPARKDMVELSYADTARYQAERLGELDPAVHLYSTSEFFERNLPREAVDMLLDRFATGPAVREIGFMPWGWRVRRRAAHRDRLPAPPGPVPDPPHRLYRRCQPDGRRMGA